MTADAAMGEAGGMLYGLAANAASRPSHPALVCGTRRLGYGELQALVYRIAQVLHARGIRRGDRVAVLLPNGVEFLAVMQAASVLGAIVVALNPRWRRDELAWVLQDSGATVLVLDADLSGEAAAARELAGGPATTQCLAVGEGGGGSWPSFDAAVADAPSGPPPAVVGDGGYNLLVYTSGTTGRPKGVVHPTFDPALGFEAQKRMVALWDFRADDVHLVAGPLCHTMPSAYASQHLFIGATVVIMPRFDAAECLRLVAAERVTTSAMVPAHFVRLLELPPEVLARFDRSSMRRILHAAAPCPVDVKRRVMALFAPDVVWEFYGATEGPGTIISPAEWRERPGSVGRPWPGVQVRVTDDDGRDLPPGTVGTVWLAPPGGQGFRYHRDDAKTAGAWREGFFTVGDLGWLDADGYLFLADRRVDLILSGGVNVYPAEIESALIAHPDVVDCAVVGLPDARWGQSICAVVEPRRGSGLDADGVRAWCRERLADYKCPRRVELVAELPREPNGKVLRRRLRERYGDVNPA